MAPPKVKKKKAAPAASSASYREEFATLDKEMAVVGFARGKGNQLVKTVPRHLQGERTRKRKKLEREDDDAFRAILDSQDHRLTMKGRAAEDQDVINGSVVFPRAVVVRGSTTKGKERAIANSEKDLSAHEQGGEELDEEEDVVGEEEQDDGSGEGGEGEASDVSKKATQARPKAASSKGQTKRGAVTKRQTRRLHQMRNIRSQKLANRHAAALSAHAQGRPLEAIEILKQVAKDIPFAPQVYSSLGSIFESLLDQQKRQSSNSAEHVPVDDSAATPATSKSTIPDVRLAEQLGLAIKAYGAYHVAALLCKKDYTLWVRAGDMGAQISNFHSRILELPSLDSKSRQYHMSERERWRQEKLRDMKMAGASQDLIGIDVPAKLALAHMEVGNLSEALTILTDAKNRVVDEGRNDFQSSASAWMLYADLMLRVGHECIQWSRGVTTNGNYLFRRWLRRWSSRYDWQERRLQALASALEAAVGAKCTKHLMEYMLERIKQVQSDERRAKTKVQADQVDQHDGDSNPSPTVNSDSDEFRTSQFQNEQVIVQEAQKKEIESFDQTTTEMGLQAQTPAESNRQAARETLLAAHKDALVALQEEYKQSDQQSKNNETKGEEQSMEDIEMIIKVCDAILPATASVGRVCSVAAELMKQMHGLDMHEGVRLVGDSVSMYMKERARIHDAQTQHTRLTEERHLHAAKSPFMVQPFDEERSRDLDLEINDDEFFSDDDDLAQEEMIDSLRTGLLPPELSFLCGVALIAEGNRNFMGMKYVEAIDELEQEASFWELPNEECEAKDAAPWESFRQAMTAPLGRTAAYAFLADVLRRTGKADKWSVLFLPTFRRQLDYLKSQGLKDEMIHHSYESAPSIQFRKNQIRKVLFTSSCFEMYVAVNSNLVNPITSKPIERSMEVRVPSAINALESLVAILPEVWKVDSTGTLPAVCIQVIEVCANCLRWFSKDAREHCSYSQLNTVVGYSKSIISFLCGTTLPAVDETENYNMFEHDWSTLPTESSWQPLGLRPLSILAYNLAVACNVSLFSGWEAEEFTLNSLTRRYGKKHFGIHQSGRRIAGILSKKVEQSLEAQWQSLVKLIPSLSSMAFGQKVKDVKDQGWYRTEVETREQSSPSERTCLFAEDLGVEVLLAFSDLSIYLAVSSVDPSQKSFYLQDALAILFPVSQFCTDTELWDSDIGEASYSLTGFEEWKLSAEPTGGTRRRRRTQTARGKTPDLPTVGPKALRFVSLPINQLRSTWLAAGNGAKPTCKKEHARHIMEGVRSAFDNLKASSSEMGAGKASLQMAVALLDLASESTCFDPFMCLQQAAAFAGQADKKGQSDVVFRNPLPKKDQCTAIEALTILGRADCLQGVYFPNEAAFLCGFVAQVCGFHRDQHKPELEWNDQWKIVSIYAYNVSTMIQTTILTVLDDERAFHNVWDDAVTAELDKGRRDGLSWKRRLTKDRSDPSTASLEDGDEESVFSAASEDSGSSKTPHTKHKSTLSAPRVDQDVLQHFQSTESDLFYPSDGMIGAIAIDLHSIHEDSIGENEDNDKETQQDDLSLMEEAFQVVEV